MRCWLWVFALFILQPAQSYPGEVIYGCPIDSIENDNLDWSGKIHLTFDDGPSLRDTPIVLDILQQYNITATFFVITANVNNDTIPLMKQIISAGHTIGSHTETHANLMFANMTEIRYEIDTAEQKIRSAIGYTPKLFRAPGGGLDHRIYQYLKSKGYTIVQWSGGCNDWYLMSDEILENYITNINVSVDTFKFSMSSSGGIICLHDSAAVKNNAVFLKRFIQVTYPYWRYVDILECLARKHIDDLPSYILDECDDDSYDGLAINDFVLDVVVICGVIVMFGAICFVVGCYLEKKKYRSQMNLLNKMSENDY